MSEPETVYATSYSGYYYTTRPSLDQSIRKAKQKNIHLKFSRCNEIYKGESYFKSKKEQQYYKQYCQSLPVRKASKSQMFKSQITNVSSIPEDRTLNKLNQLSAQTNKMKNRSMLFESHHLEGQHLQKGRKISQILNTQNQVTELQQKYVPYYSHQRNSGLIESTSETLTKQPPKTPKFSEKSFNFNEIDKKVTDETNLNKKYTSEQKVPSTEANPEGKNRTNFERNLIHKESICQQRTNSPHCEQKNYLPKRLSEAKKNDSQMSFECIGQIERLQRELDAKKKQIQSYKLYLEESRRKQEYLQTELMKSKKEQSMGKLCENEVRQQRFEQNVDVLFEKSAKDSRQFINPQDALLHFTFLLIMLVKVNFQS